MLEGHQPNFECGGTMKVLQIYKDYYPPVKGGIEKHVNLLSNGLRSRWIEVEVLVSNTSRRMEMDCCEGINVYKVPQLGRLSSAPLNFSMPFWIRKLASNADILHFHFPNPTAEFSYLVSGLKKKVVVTYHSDIVRQVYLKELYAPFMRNFLKKANVIIVTSPQYYQTSKVLCKYKDKCAIIPLGIDLNNFNNNFDRLSRTVHLRRKHGERLVLFVGRSRYYKGLHVLMEAMQKIDAKLLVVGADHNDEQVINSLGPHGLPANVEVLGELNDETLADYFHACDVFVLPSVERSEAFGIVQLEAMACGKPVVSTELGTGTSFVNAHEKTGLVIPPNNPDALAEAVNHLLCNPDICEQYGEGGISRVKQFFSLEQMVDQTVALYLKIQNGGASFLHYQPSIECPFGRMEEGANRAGRRVATDLLGKVCGERSR
ncbi:glycosyltransferase [Desulfatitalea alkaliphila]|uniref:Glycosyltransferase n=1 Tax=Desulfatitalea alkaliphila TaxID=2929485 RepID=A0AA41R762_9BACT|nr:glycosyltransferase [Desulfatitalea alkaliphila]MCJ8502475.1 glycosyltransferase [Desulfatitalea alkaliphila]